MPLSVPLPDWRAALVALDARCAYFAGSISDLTTARTVDIDAALTAARDAVALGATVREAVAALAGAAGEPEPAWTNLAELGAALEGLAARAAARADRGRERLAGLAAALRGGRVVNKFTGRANPRLDCLREPAAAELEATAERTEVALPGPDAGDWLEWAWGHSGEELVAVVDPLREQFPALCDFLDAVEPSAWVPGAPAPSAPAVPAVPTPPSPPEPSAGAPSVEAKPEPAPVPVAPKPPPSGEKKINVQKLGWGQAQIPKGPQTFERPRAVASRVVPPPTAQTPTLPPIPPPEPERPVPEFIRPEVALEPLPEIEPLPLDLAPLPKPAAPAQLSLPPVSLEPDEPPVQPGEIEAMCGRGEYLQAALLAFARNAAGAESVGPSGRAALVAHHALHGSTAAPWPDWCGSAAATQAALAARPADAPLVYLAAQCQAVAGNSDPLAADVAAVLLTEFNNVSDVRRWLDALAAVRAVPGLLEHLRLLGGTVDPRTEYAKHRFAFLEHAKRVNKITDRGAYHNRQDQFLNRHPAGKRLLELLGPTVPPNEVRGENRDIESFLAQPPDDVTRLWLKSTNGGVVLNRHQPKVLAESAAAYLRLAGAAWKAARAVARQGVNPSELDRHKAALANHLPAARAAARGKPWAALFAQLNKEVTA